MLKRVLLGPHAIPQWVPIGLHDPQDQVDVLLCARGDVRDVTRNNVVAALRPLTIGLTLPADETPARRADLLFRERRESGTLLGTIGLEFSTSIPVGSYRYWLCGTLGHTNRCLAPPRRWFHELRQVRAMFRSKEAFNFRLAPMELLRLFVFYCCPRPVSLVTVGWQDALNMFPMDLIGETEAGVFSMALRRTSPAVELIRQSKRLTLSGAPDDLRDHVYALGKHHRVRTIDVSALPFETEPSPLLRLPMLKSAVRVREIEVLETSVVGSHQLFLTRVLHDERRSRAPQMFHASGFYHHVLETR